jgi:hypothetical protein
MTWSTFLTLREVFFFAGKTYNGSFRRAILGSKRSRPLKKIPRNDPLYVLTKTKKNNNTHFKNQVHLKFMSLFRGQNT